MIWLWILYAVCTVVGARIIARAVSRSLVRDDPSYAWDAGDTILSLSVGLFWPIIFPVAAGVAGSKTYDRVKASRKKREPHIGWFA